jgi:hypothetical protein
MPIEDVTPHEPLPKPEYLGDGLYADYDGWQIRLFATNGVTTTNEVYLEPSVLQAFLSFVKTIRERS